MTRNWYYQSQSHALETKIAKKMQRVSIQREHTVNRVINTFPIDYHAKLQKGVKSHRALTLYVHLKTQLMGKIVEFKTVVLRRSQDFNACAMGICRQYMNNQKQCLIVKLKATS